MEIFMTNNGLQLTSPTTTLTLDPKKNVSGAILVSHLYPELFELLDSLKKQTVYLNLDLLLYLQKYYRFLNKNLPDLNFVALPLGYDYKLANMTITAFNSDDGAFGSLVCLIQTDNQTIGYAPYFNPQGQHKKRIKLWKKAFSQANLDYFYLNKTLVATNDQFNRLTETGRQKQLSKYLQHLEDNQVAQIYLSYENPERIITFKKTALEAGFNLALDTAAVTFLKGIFPFEDLSKVSDKRELKVLTKPNADCFDASVSLASQAFMSTKEAKEFFNVINAKEIKYL